MNKTKSTLISMLASAHTGRVPLERRIAELALGVIVALRAGELPVDRAWDELFSMDNYRELRQRKLGRPLMELFQWGMELENVAEVAPRALSESYNRMERLARQIIGAAAEETPRRRLRKSA